MNTGVIAGMSGSPVYIDGKLVGAVAISFPFSKEPLAGITPIQQMVQVVPRRVNANPRGASPGLSPGRDYQRLSRERALDSGKGFRP